MKIMIALTFASLLAAGSTTAQTTNKPRLTDGGQGQARTDQRYNFCEKTFGGNMRTAWKTNKCNTAPYGARFDYLKPAWDCYCL